MADAIMSTTTSSVCVSHSFSQQRLTNSPCSATQNQPGTSGWSSANTFNMLSSLMSRAASVTAEASRCFTVTGGRPRRMWSSPRATRHHVAIAVTVRAAGPTQRPVREPLTAGGMRAADAPCTPSPSDPRAASPAAGHGGKTEVIPQESSFPWSPMPGCSPLG